MMVTRTGTLFSANQINEAQNRESKALSRIATGKQILAAADDPAALSVTMTLEAMTRGLSMQINNRQDEISLIQTAEGALGTLSEMTQRIRELSVQASNGTLTDSDRQNIQFEIDQLNQQADQIANGTEFNTKKLLDGSLNLQLQNGNSLAIPPFDAANLGLTQVDVRTQSGASSSIGYADQAHDRVTTQRSSLGAIQNGIAAEVRNLTDEFLNTIAANSRISDADIAREIVNLTNSQVQGQAATSAFRMDNAARTRVLQLLG